MITLGIPFYNSEKYILPLIESINKQNFKEFEVVFVDNNSTDKTKELIINNLDKSIKYKIINEPRQGIAFCRNDILDNASDFICFVDSDDVIGSNYVLEMDKLAKLGDLGIVQPLFFKKTIPEFKQNKEKIDYLTSDEYRKSYTYTKDICLWNKVFSKEVIKANNIRFNTGLKIGEDADFVLIYGQYIHKISISNQILYFYRESETSTYGKFVESNKGKEISESIINIYSKFKIKLDPDSMAYVGCSEFEAFYLKKLYMYYLANGYPKDAKEVKRKIKAILIEISKKKILPLKLKVKTRLKILFLDSYLRKGLRD